MMGYVPPYIPDQNLIYGRRTESSSDYRLKLQPVEPIQLKESTATPFDGQRTHTPTRTSKHDSFKKILSSLTGKGQNINEVI